MGTGKRMKGKRKLSGKVFISEFQDRLTANFHRELRNSEMWDKIFAEFGKERAKELLWECKAELKPRFDPIFSDFSKYSNQEGNYGKP